MTEEIIYGMDGRRKGADDILSVDKAPSKAAPHEELPPDEAYRKAQMDAIRKAVQEVLGAEVANNLSSRDIEILRLKMLSDPTPINDRLTEIFADIKDAVDLTHFEMHEQNLPHANCAQDAVDGKMRVQPVQAVQESEYEITDENLPFPIQNILKKGPNAKPASFVEQLANQDHSCTGHSHNHAA